MSELDQLRARLVQLAETARRAETTMSTARRAMSDIAELCEDALAASDGMGADLTAVNLEDLDGADLPAGDGEPAEEDASDEPEAVDPEVREKTAHAAATAEVSLQAAADELERTIAAVRMVANARE